MHDGKDRAQKMRDALIAKQLEEELNENAANPDTGVKISPDPDEVEDDTGLPDCVKNRAIVYPSDPHVNSFTSKVNKFVELATKKVLDTLSNTQTRTRTQRRTHIAMLSTANLDEIEQARKKHQPRTTKEKHKSNKIHEDHPLQQCLIQDVDEKKKK